MKKDSFIFGTSIYLISNIVTALIPFAMLPLLTRYLSPSEYGEIAMFQVLIGVLSTFVGLNVNGAVVREFYNKDGEVDYSGYLSSCILILIVSSFFVFSVIYLQIENIVRLVSIKDEWILLALVVSFCAFLLKIILGQFQVNKSVFRFAFFQITLAVTNVALTLFFVIAMDYGADGRIMGITIANVIIAIFCIVALAKMNLVSFRKIKLIYLKDAFTYGFNLIPHVGGIFLLSTVDRYIINANLGLSEAGIYMSAVQLSLVFAFFYDAINKAYVPWLFGRLKGGLDSEKLKIVKNTYRYILLLLLLSVLVYFIAPFFIVPILGIKFQKAEDIIGILCLASCLNGVYFMFTNYIIYTKNTKRLSMITLVSGVSNVVLSLILIKYFGAKGVAIAFLCAVLIRGVLTFSYATKCFSMPWFNCFQVK
ncbi:lipopolysaccharide biosynthesis protein [Vibrio splendidus]|uniref:lipopolysaccharide biosynthesis protein n=1 Tax=Vibrio splendidus TaxID=29497 RepID=UPI000D3D31DC|nr:oligosaccharide flippase family protein [Vibrio splendidus]MCC4882880.1 oligosaccharide flippase family protein [Vibrio splendidus]PTO57625.1 polysaccharide biosynthesis protein [Vibrio splendidus]